jgi:hypothetical protein
MSQSARPRMARFVRASVGPARKLIVGRVYDGPQSELGKTVQIPVSKANVAELRALINYLEAEDDC